MTCMHVTRTLTIEYFKKTILNAQLNGYKILCFENPHIWLVLILAILGQLHV